MADVDIIAYLHPGIRTEGAEQAQVAIDKKANKGRYVAQLRHRPSVASPQSHSPESEDSPERADTEASEDHNSLDYTPCLRISLNDVPGGKLGLEAGSSSKADIVLPQMGGVSFRHFSLTFNNDYYFIVKDLGSRAGTSVIYGAEDGGPRCNFEWIIAGEDFLQKRGPIVIKVTRSLQFQVVIKPFDRNSAAFRAKVDRFRAGRGTGDINELFESVIIRPPTQAPSAASRNEEFFLRKEIGRGSSAVVYHLWNVRTGEHSARKVPVEGLPKSHIKKWKNEAVLQSRVSHVRDQSLLSPPLSFILWANFPQPHVVKLLGWDDKPQPSLRLEYIPEGSLRDHLKKREYFSGIECRHILMQTTSAVAHLHGLSPPIIHRDISDNNILIMHRGANGIMVKLADLGMSKEGLELNTIVGTPVFWPPELFGENVRNNSRTVEAYTKAVDIWELGVVMAKLAGGIPRYTDEHAADGTLWCIDNRHRVERRYQKQRDGLDQLLLNGMLCMDPKRRWDAQRCHEESLRLPEGSRESWKTRAASSGPSPATDEEDEEDESGEDDSETETIRRGQNYHQNRENNFFVRPDSEGVTAGLSDLVPPNPATNTTSPSASERYRRSDAPRPELLRQAQAQAQAQEVLDAIKNPENSLFLASDIGGVSKFSADPRSAPVSAPALGTVTPRVSDHFEGPAFQALPCGAEPLVPQKRSR